MAHVTVGGLLQNGQTIKRSELYETLGPGMKPFYGREVQKLEAGLKYVLITIAVGVVLSGLALALSAGLGGSAHLVRGSAAALGACVVMGPFMAWGFHQNRTNYFKQALDWTAIIKEVVPIYHNVVQAVEKAPEDQKLQRLIAKFPDLKKVELEGAVAMYAIKTNFGGFTVNQKGEFQTVMVKQNEGMVESVVWTIGKSAVSAAFSQAAKVAFLALL